MRPRRRLTVTRGVLIVLGALALGVAAGGLLLAQDRVYGGHRCVAVAGYPCDAPPGAITGCFAAGPAAGASAAPAAAARPRC